MSRLVELLYPIIWQQYDPIYFLQALRKSPHKLWWSAWWLRLGILIAAITSLLLVAYVNAVDWKSMVAVVVIVPLVLQLFCGFAISLLGQPQFWLLYAWAPLAIMIAWMCGLGVHFAFWRWVGLQIGLPFYIGRLIAEAGTVWTFLKQEALHYERGRRRTGGTPAELPTLMWRQRVRYVRLFITAILGLAILYLYPALPIQEMNPLGLSDAHVNVMHILFSLTACAAGSLGLDATLLAVLFHIPPVRLTSQWHTTYPGRTAMFLPRYCLRPVFDPEVPITAQSAAIVILLKDSHLAPVLRRAYAQLPLSHRHQLLFDLSLRDGGAEVIRYLTSTPNSPLQSLGACYADLASEAAKPFDLQSWLHVLDKQLDANAGWPNLENSPLCMLQHAHSALLSFKNGTAMILALQSLQELLDKYDDVHGDTPLCSSWPGALWAHLKQYQKRLLTK